MWRRGAAIAGPNSIAHKTLTIIMDITDLHEARKKTSLKKT
jgi:hypothetical protein